MNGPQLRAEALIDLQILLDRINRMSEQCRSGLRQLRGGKLSAGAYRELLNHQLHAQREWEAKNREYFRLVD